MTAELNATRVDDLSSEKLRSKRLVDAIAKAKAAGIEDLYHLEAGDHDILFKSPDEKLYHRATGKSAEDKSKAPQALKELALAIVVYPELDVFREICRRYPGLAMKVANDAMLVASLEEASFAKKV